MFRSLVVGGLVMGGLVATLAGCGYVVTTDPAVDDAIVDAHEQAGELVDRIAYDHVNKADDYAHSAAQVEGVEVMTVDGTGRNEGDGVTLVVRILGSAPTPDGLGRREVLVCFRLTYDRDGHSGPQSVTCPDTPPMNIPKDPKLPAGIDEVLRTTLTDSPHTTEAEVRAAIDGLGLDPRVRTEVRASGGRIGVALRASQYNCVLARVIGDTTEVWRPSRIQLAPGELSCTANTAAGGAGQTPPH